MSAAPFYNCSMGIGPPLQEVVMEQQRVYDTYSAYRDPTTALFASMFGNEWADKFVFDFLFALSEQTEGG